jgi:hypothetical protein
VNNRIGNLTNKQNAINANDVDDTDAAQSEQTNDIVNQVEKQNTECMSHPKNILRQNSRSTDAVHEIIPIVITGGNDVTSRQNNLFPLVLWKKNLKFNNMQIQNM